MPLPKDTVGCLTNVSLGQVFHRRYHQHSCFPYSIAAGGERNALAPVFYLFFTGTFTHPAE
jgi:hypothetical protein